MRVELGARFEVDADIYFWRRDAIDGSEDDGLRMEVASSFARLPPRAGRS